MSHLSYISCVDIDLLADDEIDQWLQTCKEHMNMECNRFSSTPMKGLTSIDALCCRSETPATKAANLSNAVSAESRKRDFMDCGIVALDFDPPVESCGKRICIVDDGENVIDVANSRLAATQRKAHAAGRSTTLRWKYSDTNDNDEPLGAYCDGQFFPMTELKELSTL
mmetsp:Transcript_36809/g.73372  ORF Transcript_36809/g.73372 Transcript_36809/m.73372 type:complete len:168 (-) Transcript_36809:329-832(-)